MGTRRVVTSATTLRTTMGRRARARANHQDLLDEPQPPRGTVRHKVGVAAQRVGGSVPAKVTAAIREHPFVIPASTSAPGPKRTIGPP